jgi:hypothetical protein
MSNDNSISDEAFNAIRAKAKLTYIEHPRDLKLAETLQEFVKNVKACQEGYGDSRRALFVLGNSRSGKSWGLKHHFSLVPAFQPYQNEYGEWVKPLLTMEAPKPCTAKDFLRAILDKIGVPWKARMTEGELLGTVKTQVKERGILYLHVDEAQHLIRHSRKDLIKDVQDSLKGLMQIEDWPLHTIYSGVPQLSEVLRGDDQLPNRSITLRFLPVELPREKDLIEKVVRGTATNCGIDLDAELTTDDFFGRLCHASGGSFGKIIESVQAACFLAVRRGKAKLDRRAFAYNYQNHSGCLPSDNVFFGSPLERNRPCQRPG